MKEETQKIFCIGLAKTGTTSLGDALRSLGYAVCRRNNTIKAHYPDIDIINSLEEKDYSKFFKVARCYDAFVDNPWPHFYKELANEFSNAKFILTIRNEPDWIDSFKRYVLESKTKLRALIYGFDNPNESEEAYLKTYRDHNSSVIEFFKNQPNRLLILPLEADNKWELIADFLELPNAPEHYPHLNSSRRTKKVRLQNRFTYVINDEFKLRLEASYYLLKSRVQIKFTPFKKIVSILCDQKLNEPPMSHINKIRIADRVTTYIRKSSNHLPVRTMCFEQALTGHQMLKRRKIASTIFFGVNTTSINSKTDVKAHAWLVVEGKIVTGLQGVGQYKVISSFSNVKSKNN